MRYRIIAILALAAGPLHATRIVAPAGADDAGRTLYGPLVMREAALQGVPPALADAVAHVETGYNPLAFGSSGEIGLMQVMPATAALLGFQGTAGQLYEPATNIRYGVAYLARAWSASGGNICRALMKYRAGVAEEGFSPLSLSYCQRAQAWLARQGSPLAASLAASTPGAPDTAERTAAAALGTQPIHADMQQLRLIADLPDMEVQPMHVQQMQVRPMQVQAIRAAVWHGTRATTGLHRRLQAALDEALPMQPDAPADPHVIHIPAGD